MRDDWGKAAYTSEILPIIGWHLENLGLIVRLIFGFDMGREPQKPFWFPSAMAMP